MQLESIPVFVAVSDSMVLIRSGDEDFCHPGGPVCQTPSNQKVAWNDAHCRHPGHYNNRVWTGCEQFVATSSFQKAVRGKPMPVFAVDLDVDFKVASGPSKVTMQLRSNLHKQREWPLPPRENLQNLDDIRVLEPMIAMLGDSTLPPIVAAARYQLPVALDEFLKADHDVNACDPETGNTSLMLAVGCRNQQLVRSLLQAKGIDVNRGNKLGCTACHALVADPAPGEARHDPGDELEIGRLLVEAGADPTRPDIFGRSAVGLTRLQLFPGYEEEVISF